MSFPQRPDYLSAPNPALADRFTGGLTAPQPPNISIRNGRFTVRGASGETRRDIAPSLSMDVIIVDANAHVSRMLYAEFDADNAQAPECFSDNGEGPSAFAAKPQAASCATCPQAVWGSKINQNGKAVPACASKKKVAVLVGGDSSGQLHLLAIPPNSLKGYRAYIDAVLGNGALPYQLITRISFADGEIGTLKFDWVDYIPQQLVGHVEGLIGSAEVDSVVGNKDKPRLAVLAAPAPVQQLEHQQFAPPQQQGFAPQHQPVLDQAAQRFQQGFAPPQQQGLGQPAPVQQYALAQQQQPQGFGAPSQQPPAQQFAPPPQLGFAALEPEKRKRRSSAEVAAEKAAKEAAAAGQTFVGPGPIPAQQFAPQQQGGFIGGGPAPSTAFGVASNPPPPNAAVEDMLAKAFSLPTK